VYPGLHRQSARSSLPVALVFSFVRQFIHTLSVFATAPEYLPKPQSVHASEPVTVLYLPGTHALHASPSPLGLVYPRSHLHAVSTPLPDADTVFAGQLKHVVFAMASVAVEYVLTTQSVHTCGPGLTLYLPVEQPLHKFKQSVVKSTPFFMASAIAVVAAVLRYSSTTNKPAMSAFKYGSLPKLLLPIQVFNNVLSANDNVYVPLRTITSFIDI